MIWLPDILTCGLFLCLLPSILKCFINISTHVRLLKSRGDLFLYKVVHVYIFTCRINVQVNLNEVLINEFFISLLEYYLEDVIEMLGFVPPLSDKKKKRDKDDTEVEEEVGGLLWILQGELQRAYWILQREYCILEVA